ncbi:MAG: sulfatase-like hydrolase/transferase [Burkholderiaceae bacterium]
MSRAPSFILFVADQLRADFLGCYGHPVVRTPHLDGIASRGTLFERCYVASPVCMPNRASLMTGRMPSVHGVRCNGIALSSQAVTFVELLADAGYRTGLVGKSHLQNFTGLPRMFPPADFAGIGNGRAPVGPLSQALRDHGTGPAYQMESPQRWAGRSPSVDTPFYGFGHVELVTSHGDEVGGDYRTWLRAKDPTAEARLMGPANALAHDYECPQAHRTAMPVELYPTHYIAERAGAWLRSEAHDPQQPFFLMVSFPDPHHPFNPPGHYWDMYQPDQFLTPAAFGHPDWQPPPHVTAMIRARAEGRADTGTQAAFACSAREAREAQALTAGMITCLDDAIGEVLLALGEAGRADDTVLMFTADHGDYLGDHQLLLKGAAQYDTITRVPLLWSDPAAPRDAAREPALAQTIDIPMTILARAGLAAYAGIQGIDLLPVIEQRGAGREDVLIQFDSQRQLPGTQITVRTHTLRHQSWRLSRMEGVDWGELYDLASDPGELHNLWDDPAMRDVRSMLIERMVRVEMAHLDRVPLATSLA